MMLFFLSANLYSSTLTSCHPVLWPESSAVRDASFVIPNGTRRALQAWSNKHLNDPVHALVVLHSAGKTSIHDPKLMAARNAFHDADRAAVLALTYQITRAPIYFTKTREILIGWSRVNHPTGNPIDETRLDGMIWAYDLMACSLSADDNAQIQAWFEQIRNKKLAWVFGNKTRQNNHRIHQLKMLLLLDKVLNHNPSWLQNLASAEHYSTINLNPKTGESIDYRERHALYYHNYVLQPWLEISLITGRCTPPVKKAFAFLSNHLLTHHIQDEFVHSEAPIDALRAKGGFQYAITGGTFDETRAAPTMVRYYTLVREAPSPALCLIVQQATPSASLLFLKARRVLWAPA